MAQVELQDEKELIEQKEEDLVELWRKRFKEAENYKQPFDQRSLRMYKLYKAHRDWIGNYAYNVNIMPPIGYEVIETVKPRLAAARVNVKILPTKKKDVTNPSLKKWDNLVHYNFDVMDFDTVKIDWINAQLLYGNGLIQVFWDPVKKVAEAEVLDNLLIYIDPQAKNRLQDCRWIIKQSWKEKEIIQKEEKERGEENAMYDAGKLDSLENEGIGDDPRRDRREINAKKMGMINDAIKRDDASDSGAGDGQKDHAEYKAIELWECYDFIKQEVVTIGNRTKSIRQEENPYKNINKERAPGNLFIDLPNISVNWEYYGIPLLEPVETTIYELADGRNQAMDNIVLNLDPVRKLRKGSGYKP